MPRDEVFRYIARVGAAVLAGREPATLWPSADHMQVEDLTDAMHAFSRSIAARIDQIPPKVSDDVEVQEAIRVETDKAMAQATAGMIAMVEKLQREAR